ncbi:MAG: CHRD domain-containing protein [Phenylobacterium sp.]
MRAQLLAAALVFAPAAASAQAVTLSATLAGGTGGDADGSGTASVKIDGAEVCYDLSVKDIAPATMAHIHKGAAGANGPVVVPFKAPDASGKVAACATANPDAVKDILANPAGYYVNVHNADFPGGAIRGQLGR